LIAFLTGFFAMRRVFFAVALRVAALRRAGAFFLAALFALDFLTIFFFAFFALRAISHFLRSNVRDCFAPAHKRLDLGHVPRNGGMRDREMNNNYRCNRAAMNC
jgi:hypothetical protein